MNSPTLTKTDLIKTWNDNDQHEIELAIRDLLASAAGRRLLRRWLEFGKIGVNPFTTNALTMAFGCGELNVGQQVLADIMAVSPDGWLLMQKEVADEQRNRSSALDTARDD